MAPRRARGEYVAWPCVAAFSGMRGDLLPLPLCYSVDIFIVAVINIPVARAVNDRQMCPVCGKVLTWLCRACACRAHFFVSDQYRSLLRAGILRHCIRVNDIGENTMLLILSRKLEELAYVLVILTTTTTNDNWRPVFWTTWLGFYLWTICAFCCWRAALPHGRWATASGGRKDDDEQLQEGRNVPTVPCSAASGNGGFTFRHGLLLMYPAGVNHPWR